MDNIKRICAISEYKEDKEKIVFYKKTFFLLK